MLTNSIESIPRSLHIPGAKLGFVYPCLRRCFLRAGLEQKDPTTEVKASIEDMWMQPLGILRFAGAAKALSHRRRSLMCFGDEAGPACLEISPNT